MGPCETYRFSEQYNLTVDDEPWQYWMKKETPGLAPLSQPAKRAIVPLLRAPTGNVTVSGSSRFAHSMAVSIDYLLRNYEVDNMLWWFRHRAGLAQPNASAAPQGWDRCVNNKRGQGVPNHLCLKGSVASTFLMGAGGILRWPPPSNVKSDALVELRRRFEAVLRGIAEAADASGFAAAFAENETMYRENPDYVLAWLTHGLLEANVAAADRSGTALRLARGMIDWFTSLNTNPLLPEFMPPDRTTDDVPAVYGAETGHQIYLISQGIIHHSRMATSALGRQRDVDAIALLYEEDEWLEALAAKDEKAVWQKRWFPHNYEVTAFEAYFDMWAMTGEDKYKRAVDGAWEMFRESFLHVGGSMALNEGSHGTNLSAGFWYPPKSYFLEGSPDAQFQNATTVGHKTGETCGSVFWIKLNQRYHFTFPEEEKYVGEIERSLLNVGIANQAARVGDDLAGVRSFALLHGRKNFRQNITTCCEGQGTRLHGSLPEHVFSLINAAAGGAEAAPVAGVAVDVYAAASITFAVAAADGGGAAAGVATVAVDSSFPYASDAAGTSATVTLKLAPPSLRFKLSLRVPAWVAAPAVNVTLNGEVVASAAAGSYATLERRWRDGDRLALSLPMELRATYYVGKNQVAGTQRWAYEYGPTLLAARPTAEGAWDTKKDCLVIKGVKPGNPAEWLRADPAKPMRFVPTAAANVDFVPYFELDDEQMTVYPCYEM